MNDLPQLAAIFDRLKRGCHLGPEDEPAYTALRERYDDYARYFAAIGLRLARHEREFFYFEPENPESVPDTLPRIAVFSYILIDYAANQGGSIEEYLFGQNFLLPALPHFGLDRYTALLRQVEVHDLGDLRTLLKHMERIGWVKSLGEDEFRLLRPFHRVLSQCLRLSETGQTAEAAPAPAPPTE